MKAHSMEFREHVMQAVDKGEFTQEESARVFGVNVRRIRKLRRAGRGRNTKGAKWNHSG